MLNTYYSDKIEWLVELLAKKLETNPPEVFEKIDCLECANCCKTTSPLFIQKDVDRIAKHLNMKSSSFQNKYLKRDDEFDLVLKTSPCTFLDKDKPYLCLYLFTLCKRIAYVLK